MTLRKQKMKESKERFAQRVGACRFDEVNMDYSNLAPCLNLNLVALLGLHVLQLVCLKSSLDVVCGSPGQHCSKVWLGGCLAGQISTAEAGQARA